MVTLTRPPPACLFKRQYYTTIAVIDNNIQQVPVRYNVRYPHINIMLSEDNILLCVLPVYSKWHELILSAFLGCGWLELPLLKLLYFINLYVEIFNIGIFIKFMVWILSMFFFRFHMEKILNIVLIKFVIIDPITTKTNKIQCFNKTNWDGLRIILWIQL